MYKQSRFNTVIKIGDNIFIYNSFTKAYMKVGSEQILPEIGNSINLENIQIAQYQSIKDNGFIVDESKDEISELKYIFNKNYFSENTLSIALMPSMACNFSCPYCFEGPYRDSEVNPMYFPILKRYAMKNFKYYNHVDVNMFGGEPLLFFKEMLDYLNYVAKLSQEFKFKYSCSIITNGSLLTCKVMNALVAHHCNSMQITLDGCKRTHDKTRCFHNGQPSFDLLVNKINNVVGPFLEQSEINFALRFNLLNNDIDEVKKSLLLFEHKYREYISVFFRNVYDTSCFEGNNRNSENDYVELLDYAKSLGYKIMYNQYFARSCEACSDTNFGYITSDLSFWKCLNAKDCHEEFGKVGQILEDGTIKFEAKKLFHWYRVANCFENEKCLNCSQIADCLGGCIAYCSANGTRKCSNFNLTSLPFLHK